MPRIAASAAIAAALALFPASLSAECCSGSPADALPGPVSIGTGSQLAPPFAVTGVAQTGPGYWQPGGYEARVGSPYYYSPQESGRQYWYGAMAGAPAHAAYVPGHGGWGASYGGGFAGGTGVPGDPYTAHFGPGFHRQSNYGHYRFPYYSYRRPWYFPGPAVWNRDTNFAW